MHVHIQFSADGGGDDFLTLRMKEKDFVFVLIGHVSCATEVKHKTKIDRFIKMVMMI